MDPGSLILAGTGLITGVGALYVNWRSQRDQNLQQTVANRVVSDQNELAQTKQIVDQLNDHNTRLIARAEKAEKELDECREEMEEQRILHRHQMGAQEARCREVQGSLTESLVVLRSVVNDEIARGAADVALKQPMHPHEEET